MSTRQHIPKEEWPSEQQEILRRLPQSPVSPRGTVNTIVELFYSDELIGPADQEFLVRSHRFRALRNARFIHIECLHATVDRRKESRTSRPGETRSYFCIVCRTSGKTIWRIPDEPDDTRFDCVTMTWHELP